jgi:predicted Zn-dependent protease
VQGVIAHELGHVTGGHVISDAGGKAATGIAAVAAAGRGGGGGRRRRCGDGRADGGQQAAMGKYLAFSRSQESSADAAGASSICPSAGITGRGSIEFFKKLQNMEFRYGYQPREGDDEFARTHPMTGDRIATLAGHLREGPGLEPAAATRHRNSASSGRKAKLFGYLAEPQRHLRTYPETMTGVPARYARAYAWHKEAQLPTRRWPRPTRCCAVARTIPISSN